MLGTHKPYAPPALAHVPVFIVNLENATDRRELIRLQLLGLGLTPTFWKAQRGDALTPEARARLVATDCTLTDGEIGCALSHISIWQHMAENKLPSALILEDDALLSTRVPRYLTQILALLDRPEPTVVLLSQLDRFAKRGGKRLDRRHQQVTVWRAYCAHGYVLNTAAAALLSTALLPINHTIDHWAYLIKTFGITVWGIDPYLIGNSGFALESSISGRVKANRKQGLRARLANWGYHRLYLQLLAKPWYRLGKHVRYW